jgi:hypothetical protein
MVGVRLALLALLPLIAAAADKPTLKFKPAAGDDEDDRPVATVVTVGPQGSDIALKVEFNRAPWGEACKTRCGNATLFIDTDDSTATGLQLGKAMPETGADLAITIQGAREMQQETAAPVLRVKAKLIPDGSTSIESGDAFAEFDLRRDPDRVQFEGTTVYVLVDATNAALPTGRTMRVIYHPPGQKAVTGKAKGLQAGGAGKVEIFRKGKAEGKKRAN